MILPDDPDLGVLIRTIESSTSCFYMCPNELSQGGKKFLWGPFSLTSRDTVSQSLIRTWAVRASFPPYFFFRTRKTHKSMSSFKAEKKNTQHVHELSAVAVAVTHERPQRRLRRRLTRADVIRALSSPHMLVTFIRNPAELLCVCVSVCMCVCACVCMCSATVPLHLLLLLQKEAGRASTYCVLPH